MDPVESSVAESPPSDAAHLAGNGDTSPLQHPRNRVLFGLMLLPWLAILTAHYVGNGSNATGFIQYDQPYYVANGRAAFERGDGFRYPNPSDSSADAPVIYFHWLPWALGLQRSSLVLGGVKNEQQSAFYKAGQVISPISSPITPKMKSL